MFVIPLILSFLAAVPALASASLCLQGCCGEALNLPSRELVLSSGAIVPLPDAHVPCCECPLGSGTSAQLGGDSNNPPITADDTTLPPFSIITCPDSCPCCDWCEPLADCNLRRAPTYNTVRNIIGCESLPDDTPVCPLGKCAKNCICREKLVTQLKDALLSSPPRGSGADQEPDEAPMARRPVNMEPLRRLLPKIPPWASIKPVCEADCPCCPFCQPLDPSICRGYLSTFFRRPYPAARKAVGCDTLPATTQLCPLGQCNERCMCRESLFRRLEGILLKDDARAADGEIGHDEL